MRDKRVDADARWVVGSYDGPSIGIAQYEGRLHWFSMLGSPYEFGGTRAYALYPLTRLEAFREWLAHVVMIVLVGNSETLDAEGNRIGRAWKRRHWRWLWVATLHLTDRIRSWPMRYQGRRQLYESRESPGYFIFRKNAGRFAGRSKR